MSKPTWAIETNTDLGTYQERVTLSLNLPVFNSEDLDDDGNPLLPIETAQFGSIDSTAINRYSDEFFFYVRSNGLPLHTWQGNPPGYSDHVPVPQNYVFKFPRDGVTIYGEKSERAITNTATTGFIGLAIDGVPFKSPNSGIKATIADRTYTENSVIFPVQDFYTDGSGIVGSDKKFYYTHDPKLLYTKTPGEHSPIVGYAFDGNPIYGPYGFSNPTPSNINNPGEIRPMKSSYQYTDVQRANGTFPDGTYIEDFEYVPGLGDLDQYNGRFCKTPEYPGGVYAYFITVDPDDVNTPKYPYVIGPRYFNEPLIPNGSFSFPGDISLEVISGSLPPGLRIEGTKIVGTPFEVNIEKNFRFVLRAYNTSGISDRTLSITIQGPDYPVWITPAGDLPVGVSGERTEIRTKKLSLAALSGASIIKINSTRNLDINSVVTAPDHVNSFATNTRLTSIDPISRLLAISKPLTGNIPRFSKISFAYTQTRTNLYILDNSEINYQLSAIDADLPTGQKLTYYIPPKGGELPPGITLTPTGKLTGFVQPVVVPVVDGYNGNYDMHLYDKFAYDYGVRPSNGYDSFLFDNQTWDYSDETRQPRKLNRYYQFVVRATDGIYYTDRKFRIFVVGDDHFRADNTIMKVGDGTYSADVTYLRKPIWLTPSYLGKRRANNYITTFLDVYTSKTLQGSLGFLLDEKNDDGTDSILPPGMKLDQLSGEIYGDVPYQPAVTKTYKFTVRCIRYDFQSSTFGIQKTLVQATSTNQTVLSLDTVSNIRINSVMSTLSGDPKVQKFTYVTAINVNARTVTISKPLLGPLDVNTLLMFTFIESSSRTFTLDIIGEVDSTIRFISPGDLGEIPANYVSDLSVTAVTTVPDAVLKYSIIGGALPPGLRMLNDGTIQGKVNQFKTSKLNGLTTFDGKTTTFDNNTTSVDREFSFIVMAEDQFKYSATSKIFTIKVTTPNDRLYSNLYVKPFLSPQKRNDLVNFFTDFDIFEHDKIYRASDQSFGVQNELKMLLYAGIETKNAAQYAAALGRSNKKRFRFGKLKKAIAKTPGTNDIVYEVIYIEIIDNMENDKGSVARSIITKNLNSPVNVNQGRRDVIDSDITDNNNFRMSEDLIERIKLSDRVMTADYGGQKASDLNRSEIFGNSTTNIRENISNIGATERNYLPLWMRTAQTTSGVEQGFVKAVVLCYCKPGQADKIMLNIKNSGFDFKKFDFTIDRAIIDSVTEYEGDKYIAFAAREVING